MYSIKFEYDKRGRGWLEVYDGEDLKAAFYARSGSVNTDGVLVNVIRPGTYQILTNAVETDLKAMVINNFGWWVPFFDIQGVKLHIGIHPDGGLGGTEGCIGTREQARSLMELINRIRLNQPIIPVKVEVLK